MGWRNNFEHILLIRASDYSVPFPLLFLLTDVEVNFIALNPFLSAVIANMFVHMVFMPDNMRA